MEENTWNYWEKMLMKSFLDVDEVKPYIVIIH